MKDKKHLMLTLALTLACLCAYAQEFAIRKVELAGENLNVYYDLKDTVAGNSYTIYIYASIDNFVNPLAKVTGDIGLQVKPGNNRKIVWRAKEELGDFEGKVGLEIRGKLFIPFISLKNFSEYKSFKRTQKYPITWSGGTTRNVLNFDLYRGDKLATSFTGVGNVGSYNLVIPKTVKPGKGYYFKISDSKNKDEVIYTEEFTVRRKYPIVIWAAPVAVATWAVIKFWPKPEPEEIVDPLSPERL